MVQGFSLINYLKDYPLSIKELVLPRRIFHDKETNSFEGKNDLIECNENVTNANLLDSHKVTNSVRKNEQPKILIEPSLSNSGQKKSERRVEEHKIPELIKSRNITGPTPSNFEL